ncbi:MAG: MFS transporter [Alphaproteobacteria bacterium]|nr:MFS transporter [Alphaproteobacteria bacterium]
MSETPTLAMSRRNVLVLAIAQGLFTIVMSTMIAEAALVGSALAGNPAMATVPTALQQLAVMATLFPASLLMAHVGRRAGFTLGAAFGVAGATIATLGIMQGSFWIFCAGAMLSGVNGGFGQFYRFAAVDGSAAEWKSRAISFTLAGGVITALLGPELAKRTKDLLPQAEFAGSFAALIGVSLAALLILQFIRIPMPSAAERAGSSRPMAEIMRNPAFLVALGAALVGYAGMAFVMTVTPLAMEHHHHSFESAATVIQWHILAMFAPSFFTGSLIARFGALRILMAGAALFAGCIAVNLSGTNVSQFWVGLVLLGLAWNFLYVGGTTLLTSTYLPTEKAKVQAANDFVIFGTVAAATYFSGPLLATAGWGGLNLMVAPFVALVLASVLWLSVAGARANTFANKPLA